jgi:hypothetical protein
MEESVHNKPSCPAHASFKSKPRFQIDKGDEPYYYLNTRQFLFHFPNWIIEYKCFCGFFQGN